MTLGGAGLAGGAPGTPPVRSGTERYDPGSFRDPDSRVFHRDGDVLRGLSERAWRHFEAAAATRFYADAVAREALVGSEVVEAPPRPGATDGWAAILRHGKVPFVSWPFEWTFEMLKDAALLQLDLLGAALQEGFVLKDATPYNVQWFGARPTFIDVASFERLAPGEPWPAYRQFCQLYLYPLMLQAWRGVPFQPWLRGAIDGIAPAEARRLLRGRDLLRPGAWLHVAMLDRATRAAGTITGAEARQELRRAGLGPEVLRSSVRRLRRVVERLVDHRHRSAWSEYAGLNGYDLPDRHLKANVVRDAVARRGGVVWDLGCNTGEYARIAAQHAAFVVAVDADDVCVDRLYRSLREDGIRNVLPLVANLSDLPAGVGWRGRERRPLWERGAPDVVLALALVHHLVLGANVPLAEVIGWFASLGGDLVVEFVHENDPMARRLLAHRTAPRPDWRADHFERCLGSAYRAVERYPLASGTRTLYVAEAKR